MIGPNNRPLEGMLNWASARIDGEWVARRAETREGGHFAIAVPDGSFSLIVYTSEEECSIGWCGRRDSPQFEKWQPALRWTAKASKTSWSGSRTNRVPCHVYEWRAEPERPSNADNGESSPGVGLAGGPDGTVNGTIFEIWLG